MPTFRTLAPGFECGPYTIIEEIGRGGMAIVYLAEGPAGDRCAIKTLQFARSLQPRQVKRFHREIFVVASINHVNVVRFHDAGRVDTGDTGSLMWMAQEYIDGVTLRDQIHRCGGRVPVRDVANWCEQIAGGVAAAHSAGVIHRDLKPENVMLVDAAKLIKVIDFSISKFRQWGTTTTGHAQQAVGTMGYMAPEQLNGDSADIDERTDVYALGLILFELATGAFALAPDGQQLTVGEVVARTCAYTPPRIDSLVAGFPSDLSDIADQALQKRPCNRFETMAAMREALKEFEARYLSARRQAMLRATDWELAGAPPPQDGSGQNEPDQHEGDQNKGGWAPGQKRTVKVATPEEALQYEARREAVATATASLPAAPLVAAPPPGEIAPPPAIHAVTHAARATTRSGGSMALAPSGDRGPSRSRRSISRGAGLVLGAALGYLTSGFVAPWIAPARSSTPTLETPARGAPTSPLASPSIPAPASTPPATGAVAVGTEVAASSPVSTAPPTPSATPPAPIPPGPAPQPGPPRPAKPPAAKPSTQPKLPSFEYPETL